MSAPAGRDCGAAPGQGSSAPLLKICGIRDEATARLLGQLPVDYAGFVFAPSRRQVAAAEAARLIAAMKAAAKEAGRPAPLAVGVFVNAPASELAEAAKEAGLDLVQLHGSESPEACLAAAEAAGLPVWKALHAGRLAAGPEAAAAEVARYADAGVRGLLLDTAGAAPAARSTGK